ncbi:MAG: PAS domain S-box protein [Bacteroidota bacterium]
MSVFGNNTPLYLKGKLDLSFDSVKWLYISVIVIYPSLAFLYPVLLPGTCDPVFIRITIGMAVAAIFVIATRYPLIRRNIISFTLCFYYVISGHTIYLIYANNMAAEYVISLVIIVGIGHVIFPNFKQIIFFLLFLTFFCLTVTYKLDSPAMNQGTFLISVLIIGLFTFISLVLRFNLSRNLILSSFIMDNMDEGILGVAMDDTITYANENIVKVIGFTNQEILGKDVKLFLATQEDKNIVISKTEDRMKGISEKYELNFTHREGHTINTEVSSTPTYDNTGRADGSVALITNITSRKKVEDELKKQSIIANKTDSYVILTNEKDQIEFVNQSFEKYTGYSHKEVKGRRAEDFLRGSETSLTTIRSIQKKRKEDAVFSEEIKNYRKDGSPIWLSLHVTPLKNEFNRVTGYITIGNDITIKKQAEEKLRLDSFRLGIIREIDSAIIASESLTELAHGTINYLNKLLPASSSVNISFKNYDESYRTITDGDSFETPCKQLPTEVIKELNNGIPYIVPDLVLSDKSTHLEQELLEDGKVAYVLIPLVYNEELLGTLNIFWEEKDENLLEHVELIQGTARDLAISIKQLELQSTITQKNKELESRLNELEATHEELRSFSYIVSHDLKAPLRAISSLAQWLESDYKEKLDEEGRDYLSMLINRTNRLHHLIEGILEYSRIGRKDLEKENVNTMEIVKSAIDLVSTTNDTEVIIDSDLPRVWYNSTQLLQVFQNLIGNAIKFIDRPDGKVSIGYVEYSHIVEFYIKDNGPGINPDHFDRVFKIFQTLHARDNLESTGIGLTIVKKIVELNGGRVWLDKKSTNGTCIRFSIPLSNRKKSTRE